MFSKEKTKELLNLISHSTEELITVKIPECESVKLCGSNYVDVIQGSKEWFNSRVGIITASKIPALLGLCGHSLIAHGFVFITSLMRACRNLRNLGTLRGAKLMKGQL